MTIKMTRRAEYELEYMKAFLAKDLEAGIKLITDAKTTEEMNAINAAQTLTFQLFNEGLRGDELRAELKRIYGL